MFPKSGLKNFKTGSYQRARKVAPTRCGGGGGLLLLKRVGLQGVIVVDLLGVVVFDTGLPVVVVPLLLLLDLMLNL